MPTDYLLIDLENVSPDWIPNLMENQAILLLIIWGNFLKRNPPLPSLTGDGDALLL
jgi:hypothetical protein